MKSVLSVIVCALAMTVGSAQLEAAIITFDTLVTGQTSFSFDGDGDGVSDVVFSTTDPLGFNTLGPGLNQSFIHEPGLEGTSLLNPDLRVDFANGAVGPLSFGFALDTFVVSPSNVARIRVFDSGGTQIGFSSKPGAFTSTPGGTSDFPEGVVNVSFAGVASYATFNFTAAVERFIIDDFSGTFGSTESITPEPASFALIGAGMAAILFARYRSANRAHRR